MKSKFNFLVTLFIFAFFIANADVEKKKEFHESWAASGVETLSVINKFGEIKINNNGGNEVTVDVVVTVEASSESKALSLLNQIDVNLSKSGNTVKAVTNIGDDFKGQSKFSIDYTINIPSDKNLDIDNKFGNTIVKELNARGTFNINYGNLTATKLNAPGSGNIIISLSYGKADIESISDGTVEIKYSKMNVSEVGSLKVLSKYSVLSIDEIKSINIDSKYDTYNFEEAGSVTAETKYTHISIEELKKNLKVNSGYGSVKVKEVSAQFESINVENSYGAVSLGIGDEVSYQVKASCNYCDIDYNSEHFKGNRISENHTKSIDGKIGTSPSSAKVIVSSRYGGIKLR